ncbi:MAG: MBL fold metallo-hydrolase [Oscillospiraceae bacterium]|nr:MBL fold metallo-hydrolase [Oscillospiraceae bacterium]
MKVTYIHHSGFLVETKRFYYLFDYESGALPAMDRKKPIFVLSSHSHADHYNPETFSLLSAMGMQQVQAVLSDDIAVPAGVNTLQVAPGKEYTLGEKQRLTTFLSTDLGVAFLLEDDGALIYHAGDLNDWVWDEETPEYNRQMTENYHRQIALLAETLQHRVIDTAFVVLDPRQEADYDRGLLHFLAYIPVKAVYPMHYWDDPGIIDKFIKQHPRYSFEIQHTEKR